MHVIKMKVLLIDTQVRHMEICLAQNFILSLYLFIFCQIRCKYIKKQKKTQ